MVHKFEVVQKKYRFLKYSCFVWGTATLLLSITILVDHAVDVLNIDSSWKVGFGYHECYAKSELTNQNYSSNNLLFSS